MIVEDPRTTTDTHEVTNQSTPLEDFNVVAADAALMDALEWTGASWAKDHVLSYGAALGSKEMLEQGRLANENPPILHTHDRFGHRIDEVKFHPAYHAFMKLSVEHELHAFSWNRTRIGATVAHSAMGYAVAGVEAGHSCPMTMAYAVVPSLRHQPEVAAEWEPRVRSNEYDSRFIPASEKHGSIMGMAMTEKQGGSDVRANTTYAEPINGGGPGGEYLLTGHKWFCSAPMCDAFLTLARTESGISCFIVPRFLPDGTLNRFFIQRLKDKLGNRSNASSEIEYNRTWAQMVGEEGRGIPTIIEMVGHTRLDCIGGSGGLMRMALMQAMHHCGQRAAFGRILLDQPLMRNVLADLAIEAEAATATHMRIALAYDEATEDESKRPFARIATAITKYWVCKRTPAMVYEAMECMGGAGYVEEGPMPRIYRESPLCSIWEGSGNVMCLDVLRAMRKEPESLHALMTELEGARGADAKYDAHLDKIHTEITNLDDVEMRARRLVEMLAKALQGSVLIKHAPTYMSDAYCASRLAGDHGDEYGTLASGTDFNAILARARPQID